MRKGDERRLKKRKTVKGKSVRRRDDYRKGLGGRRRREKKL